MTHRDPVSAGADRAIAHLNEDHADALLDMVQVLADRPEATAARCVGADSTGLDLLATTPAGEEPVRVPYGEPISEPAELRKATVKLATPRAPAATPPPDRRSSGHAGATVSATFLGSPN